VSRHGESGLTVPPSDPEALAAALNTLLADADLRGRLGAAGRRRAATDFTAKRMATDTLEIYREVMNRPTHAVAAAAAG
jgi:glycosyltransferase involved in cell wall biosynthesis